jgi:prepilin-type N-terminal cleavage/methylation domain-containing protein
MIQKLQKYRDSGFTIIEVMIVLAIAGLIMLIVFLAVPALQRNAHNTSIKNDVAGILGGINEFTNNNNGTLPTAASIAGNVVTLGANCAVAGSNCATVHVGYITAVANPTAVINTAAPALGTVNIFTTAVCNGNTPVAAGATPRNFVAYYQLEGGALQCTAS